FKGTVQVSTKPQDPDQKVALKSVSAGIDLSISDGALSSIGFDVGGSFKLFDLTVSTVGTSRQPFTFEYNLAEKQFWISGGLELDFSGNKLVADFGTVTSPGIIIKDGVLTDLNASLTIDVESKSNNKLNGLQLYTTSPNGLQFIYNRKDHQF